MNYLSVDSISKSFGERVLFENVTFGIGQGQKVALVGVNGSGKTTLLKILAGVDVPDKGEVVVNNEVSIAYLEQQPEFETDHVIEAVLSGNKELAKLIEEYEYHLSKAESDPKSMERLTELMSKMDEADAWTFESQIKEILGKLGIEDLSQNISSMSGGQKKRVGLAKALMEKPDLVILDEPTNHLDLEAIEWLEKYLASSQMAIVMVTHDRYFLENVTNEIIELDNQQVYSYSGNYSYFLDKKAERETIAQSEKEKARNLYKTELEWIRRQPKARGTKAKYRIDAFEDTKKKAHVNLSKSEVNLDIEQRRQGGKVLELEHLNKSFGDKKLINDFSYTFKKGDRIGIIGHNGSGKSTFLKIITGKLAADSGKVDKGQSTVFGYYEQAEPNFKSGMKVIEVVQEVAEFISIGKEEVSASRLLTQFNFAPKAQYDYVDNLSGGEKRRLQLLKVLMGRPNFLILDEPTNDLDLITLRTLEEFLHQFQGCLVIVSHDRYFMDRLVQHLFVFEEGKAIKDFPGNYSVYRESKAVERKENKPDVIENKDKTEKVKDATRKLTYNEKREFEQLESEIEKLNEKIAEMEQLLISGETDHAKLISWGEELDKAKSDLDAKELRWLELSELN
ncbi:ABC-F family ATP-binding cassette domain-containing protein [Fulvivirga lutea]|uniref:ABC-F family ATP-binding cassette domain-containing protein n=1 Tax=Fulvivirga lutea TaxID=2810512 RepID=A0A974WHG6_9BACT|nr:ABC-F family ATP-binding cassette domain-containing protein [Fulvivirga lutea]QSE97312.1 ABC-F family ATP-binding cassette domain-containing protein [Fulvivirga lutea]